MRIEVSLHHDDPAAATLRAIPSGERAAGLRALLRLHAREIPALLGLTPAAVATAPASASPPAAPALRVAVTPGSASAAPPKAAPVDRAALAHRLVSLGAACTKAVAGLAIASALAFGLPPAARAATPSAWALDLSVASIHTAGWARRTLNQRNPGLGVEYHFNRTWGVMGGEYLNSYRAPTWYAAGVWTPLHLGQATGWHMDAGIAAGLASGYGHAWAYRGAWVPDHAAAIGWRWNVTRHRYIRNPLSPLMAAGIVRVRVGDGIGVNVLWVPNGGRRSSGFVGLQLVLPLH